MFKSNIVSPLNVGDVVKRETIPFGNVFDYVSGNGTRYGAITSYKGTILSFKLHRQFKENLPSGGAIYTAVKSTCTPSIPKTTHKDCTIRGFYAIALHFAVVPIVKSWTSKDRPEFGAILSVPNALDTDGNPHLFMNLGPTAILNRSDELNVLKLTESHSHELPVIVAIPTEGLMAVRGRAELEISEQKET
jgi:hypothetical protein